MSPLRKWEVICTPLAGRAVKHVTRAASQADAEAKIRRAYPGREWRGVTATEIRRGL